MIELHDTRREELPLTDKQFQNILGQIADNLDLSTADAFEIVEKSFIFDQQKTEELAGGFELVVQALKNEEDEIGISIRKMVIFESEDEWLDAYKRIKDSKESKIS